MGAACTPVSPRGSGRTTRLALAAAALGLAAGCVGELDEAERALFLDATVAPPDLGGPACPDVEATILSSAEAPKGCAQSGCHSASAAAQGLDLESPDIVGRLADVPTNNCSGEVYIDATDPAASHIVTKISAVPQPCGLRMPFLPEGHLSETEVQCVIDYIAERLPGPTDAGRPDGGATDLGTPDMGVPDAGEVSTEFAIEAEAMTLEGGYMVFSDDPGASGGAYVTRTGGTINDSPADPLAGLGGDPPRATVDFTMPADGPVRVFGRVWAEASAGDSFWVRVNDDGAWIRWNDLFVESDGAWVWDDVHDSDDNGAVVLFPARAGTNTLTIVTREPDARLDRIIITQDPGFSPPG